MRPLRLFIKKPFVFRNRNCIHRSFSETGNLILIFSYDAKPKIFLDYSKYLMSLGICVGMFHSSLLPLAYLQTCVFSYLCLKMYLLINRCDKIRVKKIFWNDESERLTLKMWDETKHDLVVPIEALKLESVTSYYFHTYFMVKSTDHEKKSYLLYLPQDQNDRTLIWEEEMTELIEILVRARSSGN